MKKLAVGFVIFWLSISLSNADYTKDLEDTVLKQEKIIVAQYDRIIALENKLDVLDERLKGQYLIRVPFTKIGITKDHANGAIVGFVLCLIIV